MWVKICGNTNLADALHAMQCGADALGFIFARSPRQMTAGGVAAITAQLPEGIERVGVFDSDDGREILRTAREAGLTTVQLHGGFDEDLLRQLWEADGGKLAVIQTLHWSVDETGREVAEKLFAQFASMREVCTPSGRAIRVLVDSRAGGALGGTGVSFDWEAAAEVFDRGRALGLELVAAGGLRPENVSEAAARLKPWGVDVSSGVEVSPGRKDPARVATFIAKARG